MYRKREDTDVAHIYHTKDVEGEEVRDVIHRLLIM